MIRLPNNVSFSRGSTVPGYAEACEAGFFNSIAVRGWRDLMHEAGCINSVNQGFFYHPVDVFHCNG